MKLISLTCDQPSFRPLHFNSSGLTVIVGDGSKDHKEGSSNGVGKTLALGLVHHCLGAKADKLLAEAIPNWWFSLLINLKDKEYKIDRSGDGKKISIINLAI